MTTELGRRPVAARLRLRLRRRHLRPRRAGHAGPGHTSTTSVTGGGLRGARATATRRPRTASPSWIAASRPTGPRRSRSTGCGRPTAVPAAGPQRHRVGSGRPFARPDLIRPTARRISRVVCDGRAMDGGVEIRLLAHAEAPRCSGRSTAPSTSICSSNKRGTELVERPGDWSAPPWDADGSGEHSVAAKRHELEHDVGAGGSPSARSWAAGSSGSASSYRIFGQPSPSWRSST